MASVLASAHSTQADSMEGSKASRGILSFGVLRLREGKRYQLYTKCGRDETWRSCRRWVVRRFAVRCTRVRNRAMALTVMTSFCCKIL
jgi:hypothetical protein